MPAALAYILGVRQKKQDKLDSQQNTAIKYGSQAQPIPYKLFGAVFRPMIYRDLADVASDARDQIVCDTNLTASSALCNNMYKKFGYSFASSPVVDSMTNKEVSSGQHA